MVSVPSRLKRLHEMVKATGGQQKRLHVDTGYDHMLTGSETKGGRRQVFGESKAAAEEQKEQQDIIVFGGFV